MGWCLYNESLFEHHIVYSTHQEMDANPCLLVFKLIFGLGLLLSHTTHVVEANEAVSAPSSADANVPSFHFPYKFKAVSKRLKSPQLPTPPSPTPNGDVHTRTAPMHQYNRKSPPRQLSRSPSPPPPPPPPSPLEPPV
ncbi:Uncharacterized protein TCM_044396 [Theobroma cacao]|uniref:Uncharacterized protein n=1 Tax=Theobroma cacao TaxID=3641 RepID=A0A061FRN4_THECC|nr:Uncharacterized protein TCM_044396 [Theobroma cacao]